MSAVDQRPWRTLTDEEKAQRQAARDEERRKAALDSIGYPMTDAEIQRFLGLESKAAAARMVAEGRLYSRWSPDVQRHKARRDSQPQPGKTWPPTSTRVMKSSGTSADELADETEHEDSGEPLESDE